MDVWTERAGCFVIEFNLGLHFLEVLFLAVLKPLFSLASVMSIKENLRGFLMAFVDALCYNFVFSLFIDLPQVSIILM